MRNPFATESSAFHFLLLTAVAFGFVIAASVVGGTVPALVVWIAVTVGAVLLYRHRRTWLD